MFCIHFVHITLMPQSGHNKKSVAMQNIRTKEKSGFTVQSLGTNEKAQVS